MTTHYVQIKTSEEAKVALETIKAHIKPDMDIQEISSLAITEYIHAYHPDLEPIVANIITRRQEARRGDEAGQG